MDRTRLVALVGGAVLIGATAAKGLRAAPAAPSGSSLREPSAERLRRSDNKGDKMKKFVLALALAVGVMMVAAMPALAAKPVPPPAPPAPALQPGGLTTQACPVGQKLGSGSKAVYCFKGRDRSP